MTLASARNEWAQAAIKRLCHVRYGLGQPPRLSENGIPIIRATNINRGRIDSRNLIYAQLDDLPLDRAPLLQEGEILIVRSGAYTGDSARVTSKWSGSAPGYDLRITPASADSRFLAYSLLSKAVQDQISLTKSRAAQPHLNADELGEIRISAPTASTQQAVADFLDAETARIDALITKKGRVQKLLRSRIHALRRHLILEGTNPTSNGDPGDDRVQLGVIVNLQRGHDLPLDARKEGGVPVVSSGGVSGSHDIAAATSSGVVTGRYGTIGEVFFLTENYWPLNTTLYVKNFRGNWPKWIYHVLIALPLDIDSAKSAVTGIDRNIIGQLRVPLPPISRQRELASQIDKEESLANHLCVILGRQIAVLQERRQALITAAVTGKLDIPGVGRAG